MHSETRYATSGDLSIAYQVVGAGPLDLVVVWGNMSHLDTSWEEPSFARFLDRLASFSRVILFDKRGTGLSDRVVGVPTLEERMDDVRAVMDAVGSERAAIFGTSAGGSMSALFAATYPERTAALVLFGAFAKAIWDPAYPWGATPEVYEHIVEAMTRGWGALETLWFAALAPSRADDERFRRWWARHARQAGTPGAFAALMRMDAEIDVRHILPVIRVPTLVLHRVDDIAANVGHGRYLAEHIPGAKYVELQGTDHAPFVGDADALLDEIEEFLTGVRAGPPPDRVLATVLFTDIVGSTERAAALGDRGWRDLLEGHQALVRRELARFRGREVKTLGDGFLATFDGPARAIRCASAIRDGIRTLGVEIRAGLHTGECELMGDDLGGIAVHIGARVAAKAAPSEVLVSSTVKDLVAGSGLPFADRGMHNLRGVPGEWRLFAVEG